MKYVARVTREGKHWLVDFPDAPGCQTFAKSRAELEAMARDALLGWLNVTIDHGRQLPRPKARARSNDIEVAIPSDVATAMQLRWAREDAHLTQAQLAKLAGVSQQQIAKLERPGENPTIGTLAKVAKALGRSLDVVFS